MAGNGPAGKQHALPAHPHPLGQGREAVGDALPICLSTRQGWKLKARLHIGPEPGQGQEQAASMSSTA